MEQQKTSAIAKAFVEAQKSSRQLLKHQLTHTLDQSMSIYQGVWKRCWMP